MSFLSFLFALCSDSTFSYRHRCSGMDGDGRSYFLCNPASVGFEWSSRSILVMSIGKLNNGHAMSSVQFLAWDLQF